MKSFKKRLHIDIETYSSIDISNGVYKYSESSDFEILLFAYSYDDGPVLQIDLATDEDVIPVSLIEDLIDPDVIKVAHNAQFERVCLSRYIKDRIQDDRAYNFIDVPDDFQFLDPIQWECTMCHAAMLGLPGKLEKLGPAIGLAESKLKLKTGQSLIRFFSIPQKVKQGTFASLAGLQSMRNQPEDYPEKWQMYKEYNLQDVVTEKAVDDFLAVYPIPDKERAVYAVDQMINDNGVHIALDLVQKIQKFSSNHTDEVADAFYDLTGISKIKAVGQVKNWLTCQGVEVENLQKETLEDLMKTDLPDKVREALELKLEASKTSITKYDTLAAACCQDGRVHGLFQYYGSRTGRWAGRLVQPQNLPRNEFEDFDYARSLVVGDDWEELEMGYKSVNGAFATLIRTMFIPEEGKAFAVADYSAIEARVIAWLAGEEWRQEAFKNGKDIYCESASMMFHVPVEKRGPNAHLRKKGKVAELALGYQGGMGAMLKMGAEKMGLPEDEITEIIKAWRKASPHICKLWKQIQDAAEKAITRHSSTCINGKVTFGYSDDCMTVQLPSGRILYYQKPKLKTIRKRDPESLYSFGGLSYKTKTRQEAYALIKQEFPDCEPGQLKETACFYESEEIIFNGTNQTTKKFGPINTYGGKLTENIIQAIARDCLAETLLKLAKHPEYKMVMHVHDEVILEVPADNAEEHLKIIEAVMAEPIPWADALILTADGFTSNYYKKD